MILRKILYPVSVVAVLIGLWGLYDRLIYSHENVAYGSYVVWGLWVALYLFFVGAAAGCFLLATLDYLFRVKLFDGTGRLSLYLTLVTLGAGLLHIWLDLGHLERIYKVYVSFNWESVMTQIVWGYTLFGVLTLVALWLAMRHPTSRWLKAILIAEIPLALFLSGGVGALLGVQAARPFWHVGLFPVQFPVFSIASGVALLLAVIGLFGDRADPRRPQQLWVLAVATVVLHIIKLYFVWADFSQSIYGGVPMNVAAVNAVMFGPYWWAFWILQIGLGTLVPVAILVRSSLARNGYWAGWAGVLTLVGFAVARANIVFPALTVPELEALQSAFYDPRLQFVYFPSAMEWAVSIGLVGLAVLAFLIGHKWLQGPQEVRLT